MNLYTRKCVIRSGWLCLPKLMWYTVKKKFLFTSNAYIYQIWYKGIMLKGVAYDCLLL